MQSSQPLVSVVIPCYNHEKFVQDSIQSVIDQTYENIELIIIDDGSKDNSVIKIQEMIESCKKRFTRFEFRSRSNIGLSATLNEALEWCEGKYFSALASDDQMLSIKSIVQVDYLENHPEVQAVMGGVNWIDSSNNIISKRDSSYKEYRFEDIFLSKQKLYACTQLSRLDSIKSVGGYKLGCPIEDWYMWLKLAEIGKLVNLDILLVCYRLHEDNTIKKLDIIYSGMMEIVNEYNSHPLYLKAVKQIVWIKVASIIKNDKSLGWVFFKSTFEADKMVIFNKNFFRCIRNFLF